MPSGESVLVREHLQATGALKPGGDRKGDPFQGLRVGSCLSLRIELLEETYDLTKRETSLGRGIRVESSRVREPRRTALPHGSLAWVFW